MVLILCVTTLNLRKNKYHQYVCKIALLNVSKNFIILLIASKAFTSLKLNDLIINRHEIGHFLLLLPVTSHFPLVAVLLMSKEKQKILRKIISNSNATLKLVSYNNALAIVMLFTTPLYALTTPFFLASATDFKFFILSFCYGASALFLMIALFAYNTRNTLGPHLQEIITINKKRLEDSLYENKIRINHENNVLKGILFQEKMIFYFFSMFSTFSLATALMTLPFQYISIFGGMSFGALGSIFIISKPFLMTCLSQPKTKKFLDSIKKSSKVSAK